MRPGAERRLVEAVREIAQAAGRAVMAVYDGEFAVELKADRSPLTAADRAAHAIIRDGLSALRPALPVLSEESSPDEVAERRRWACYWLVDPLDGTREFVKRNGEFTVNIALIEHHRAVLGVVTAPAVGTEYGGALGSGAWRRGADGPAVPIRVRRACPQRVRVMGSRSHPSAALAAYLHALGPHELRPMGSSLKICLVADGQADCYPRLGPTSEWDTAAAQAILESAGGGIMDLAGRPLRYNTKDALINPHFVAFGDPERDWLQAVRSE